MRQTKTLGSLLRSKRGLVSSDGEALRRAGLSRGKKKKQRGIVETKFEVVGRHPTGDVSEASGDACLNLSVRGWKRKVVEVELMIYILSCTPDEILHKARRLSERLRQVAAIFFTEEVKKRVA